MTIYYVLRNTEVVAKVMRRNAWRGKPWGDLETIFQYKIWTIT